MEENSTKTVRVKRCNKCQRERPLTSEFFHRARISSDGFRGKCKKCRQPALACEIRELRRARKSDGLCVECGLPSRDGRTRCATCATTSNGHGSRYFADRHAAGLCFSCREPVEDSDNWQCGTCRKNDREQERQRRVALIAQGLCVTCGREPFVRSHHQCAVCYTKRNASQRASNARIRAKVYDAYGGRCACCGESELRFLTIDHVHKDGARERRENKSMSGLNMMRRLVKLNFPDSYRLLCWNCNCASYIYGICPHKGER